MDKKELMIGGIVVILAVVVGSIIFAPINEAQSTNIEILNNGDIGENSTLYIKLKDDGQSSLSNKTIHVKLTDDSGNVVFNDTVQTRATGVAVVKLSNVSGGNYTLDITFDGDDNYTACSFSQKITIQGGEVEDDIENDPLIQDTLNDDSSSGSSAQTPSRSSGSSGGRSSGGSGSGSGSGSGGSTPLPEYDEEGNLIG